MDRSTLLFHVNKSLIDELFLFLHEITDFNQLVWLQIFDVVSFLIFFTSTEDIFIFCKEMFVKSFKLSSEFKYFNSSEALANLPYQISKLETF